MVVPAFSRDRPITQVQTRLAQPTCWKSGNRAISSEPESCGIWVCAENAVVDLQVPFPDIKLRESPG